MVSHLALKILNSRESAEEVVYDVFWQVWRDAERYDVQRGSVGAWLATVARSRAIDALRARRGNPATEEDIEERPVATNRTADAGSILFLIHRQLRWRQHIPGVESGVAKVPIDIAVRCVRAALRHDVDVTAQGASELGLSA